MERPKHISELLPDFCERIGIPCPEEVINKAAEMKEKLDKDWEETLLLYPELNP